jgi:ABC-type phosphate/phosphonate transport system substrate-binding protein
MAGSVYPLFALQEAGLDGKALPEVLWSGTHDDVIEEVVAGRVDAGAAKDVRVGAYEGEHPEVKFRRIATGPRAPESALVMRRGISPDTRDAIVACLLGMAKDPAAGPVLGKLKLRQFEPCGIGEYGSLYEMIEAIGPRWGECGIEGPAPKLLAPPTGTTRTGGS